MIIHFAFILHFLICFHYTIYLVNYMKVKIFDFEHELDLEKAINNFLQDANFNIIDIKYQVSNFYAMNEQVFSFSAMIIFDDFPQKT